MLPGGDVRQTNLSRLDLERTMTQPGLPFRKSQRIVRGAQFGHILRRGKCVADEVLVLCALRSESEQPPRIGVTIPKKCGPATIRNRWKRLIRESFRIQQHELPNGYDFIVRPKKGAQPDWRLIKRSIPTLARRAVKLDRRGSRKD